MVWIFIALLQEAYHGFTNARRSPEDCVTSCTHESSSVNILSDIGLHLEACRERHMQNMDTLVSAANTLSYCVKFVLWQGAWKDQPLAVVVCHNLHDVQI